MKRSKKIYMLLGVLVVACITTFAVIRYEEHKEKIRSSDEIILEIPSDSVKSLSWEYESRTLTFNREESWIYSEDEEFPVDEEKMDELLKPFEEFGASFTIEDVKDYGQYGLDDPICTINLSTADKSYEILLGNYSEMDAQRYVSIGDGNVYLVKDDPLNYYKAELKDLIDNDDPPKFKDVEEIHFAGAETYRIIYEEDSENTYRDGDVYFAQLSGKSLPLDTTRVNDYLRNIKYLDLTDYVTYKATAEDLTKYGLDKPELTVTLKYTVENDEGEEIKDTFVLHVSRDPEERKAAEDEAKAGQGEETGEDRAKEESDGQDDEEEITAYARVDRSKIIYRIKPDDYKELMAASYNSLRHLEVLPADFEDIGQMDISLESKNYTITSEKKDDERIYYYEEEELEIKDLRDALESIKAEGFTDERPKQSKEISLTVYLDMVNDPKILIDLYRYDGTYCLAMVDRKPLALVKRSNVVDLIEAVHAIVLN
ncbi:MAG: DUF4340 domain-containing protein [Anaerovoracaceae bacterium]|jgi:hypothetical protein